MAAMKGYNVKDLFEMISLRIAIGAVGNAGYSVPVPIA
jgi:hypothetical protein